MRRKKNIYDMVYHYDNEIGSCEYCNEKATHVTLFGNFFSHGWRLLCKKHYTEWVKGELFI